MRTLVLAITRCGCCGGLYDACLVWRPAGATGADLRWPGILKRTFQRVFGWYQVLHVKYLCPSHPWKSEISHTFIRGSFVECPTCRVKPGSPTLCWECLERREMYSLLEKHKLLPKR